MNVYKVDIPAVESSSYQIKIGTGLLVELWTEIESEFQGRSKMVVTDSNVVSAGHLDSLSRGRDLACYVIDPPGEINKKMSTILDIVEKMEELAMGRDSVIVAMGGGTVGDMAGFAAAIYKRGIPVVHIPTTTVSQADSSIGGKTGVDSSLSKNAFGAFWHPSAVFIDVETLKTLDERQFRAGLVESVKHALIASEEYFNFIEDNIEGILCNEGSLLEELALWNCRIKAEVVSADPTEKNQRRILNYGHTIGHAVESALGFELLHGECVAIGIVGAGMIENELGLGDESRLERIVSLLRKLGVPVKIPGEVSKNELVELIIRDKKSIGGWPRFALIEGVGKAYVNGQGQWAHKVDKEIVLETIDNLY